MNHIYKNTQLNNISLFLYKIIIIFMVFDGVRDALVISSYISPIKELSVLLLFSINIFRSRFHLHVYNNFYFKNILIFSSTIFIYAIYTIHSVDTGNMLTLPYIMYYKYVQFFILCYLFLNFQRFTNKNIIVLIDFFIKLLIISVILTPFLYFLEPSFLKSGFKQWGRIGVGYPTMDGQVLVFGLSLILLIKNYSLLKGSIIISLLILGILMQNTGTAYVTTTAIILYYLFFTQKNNLKSIYFVGFILLFLIMLILYEYSDLLKNFLWLFTEKIDSIISGKQSVSEQIRAEQFLNLKKNISSMYELLFGLGFKIYVENQYSFMIVGFGYVGLLFFALFLSNNLLYGFIIRKRDYSILFTVTIIFSLTSYTLVSLYLFPTEALFAFGIGISYHYYKRKKIAINN